MYKSHSTNKKDPQKNILKFLLEDYVKSYT